MKIIEYAELSSADLKVDAVYEGGSAGNASDDPISQLLPGIGNMAGFRAAGRGDKKKFVVLYTSGEDKDWPDTLNTEMGRFTYYGDNKCPGRDLHETSKGGNSILRNIFNWLHANPAEREKVPPLFVFKKFPTEGSSRSVQFKGLAVPGYQGLTATEDLVAVWKTTDNQRFQNYKAIFTILDIASINRTWIEDLAAGNPDTENAPKSWKTWRERGIFKPLVSESTTVIRSVETQSPENELQTGILSEIFEYFKDVPIRFEAFAARIFQMLDERVIVDNITRGVVDGGRDAVERYLLGLNNDPVYAEFSLEAKCYQPPINGQRHNPVGVKEVSRLISRIRHRQFGVLVTTSVIASQAYKEVREDRHPVIFISGKDIAEILIKRGFNTSMLVKDLLEREYPIIEVSD